MMISLSLDATQQGKHPMLLRQRPEHTIGNDTYVSTTTKLHIIEGPNMAGKSVYLRQVGLQQVMAQIGSFVPAQYAVFRIADQVG